MFHVRIFNLVCFVKQIVYVHGVLRIATDEKRVINIFTVECSPNNYVLELPLIQVSHKYMGQS